jgi:hypothetical protein
VAVELEDWLPEGQLAWLVIDAVAAMDLTAFYAAYREDGRSRPAYEPSMMFALRVRIHRFTAEEEVLCHMRFGLGLEP